MSRFKEIISEYNVFILLASLISTGILFFYRQGISGNDFWWHIKAGEWMVNNKAIPGTDVFSWYAKENGIEWISHEWLFDVVFYKIYCFWGDMGIYLISLFSALVMALLILVWNKNLINNNFIFSILFLFPIVFLFPTYFYGRPQIISYFLLFGLLSCLYTFKNNENSQSIYFVPLLSILWSNFHGGSSNIPYILCFIFFLGGLIEFAFGKLVFEKLSSKQLKVYLSMGIISVLVLPINPHGLDIMFYPFVNIGDTFLQSFITEWAAPDAKDFFDLIIFFMPLFMMCLTLITTDKKVKVIDIMVILFFTYLSFRSIRFCVLFYIAISFFIMNYFIFFKSTPKTAPVISKTSKILIVAIILTLLSANIYSINNIIKTSQQDDLISIALDSKFIDLVKNAAPKRLFNDYNFGETLIYNDILTFVDARADVFSKYNMHDAMSLLFLTDTTDKQKTNIFDPELIIEKYNFDAFLIDPKRNLASYLESKPEEYELVMENDNAVYFRHKEKAQN